MTNRLILSGNHQLHNLLYRLHIEKVFPINKIKLYGNHS